MNIKQIQKLIRKYQPILGLGDWIITARRPKRCETDARALVIADSVQMRADTAWNLTHKDWINATDDEREQVILHELCHILCSRWSQVQRDVIEKYTDESIQEELLDRLDDQEEGLVGKLSSIFRPLVKGEQ